VAGRVTGDETKDVSWDGVRTVGHTLLFLGDSLGRLGEAGRGSEGT